jgi:hypothetical protein
LLYEFVDIIHVSHLDILSVSLPHSQIRGMLALPVWWDTCYQAYPKQTRYRLYIRDHLQQIRNSSPARFTDLCVEA